jgi:S1-C subfamily serine protease
MEFPLLPRVAQMEIVSSQQANLLPLSKWLNSCQNVARRTVEMGTKSKIAVVVSAAFLLAAGLIIYFHQPPKPVRIHPRPMVTEFVGVGMQLRMDPRIHAVVIQGVIASTPAAEAGVTSGLMLSKVDGLSIEDKTLAECVSLIRGPVGTTVQLELVTPDRSRTNTVELTRRKLKL